MALNGIAEHVVDVSDASAFAVSDGIKVSVIVADKNGEVTEIPILDVDSTNALMATSADKDILGFVESPVRDTCDPGKVKSTGMVIKGNGIT